MIPSLPKARIRKLKEISSSLKKSFSEFTEIRSGYLIVRIDEPDKISDNSFLWYRDLEKIINNYFISTIKLYDDPIFYRKYFNRRKLKSSIKKSIIQTIKLYKITTTLEYMAIKIDSKSKTKKYFIYDPDRITSFTKAIKNKTD